MLHLAKIERTPGQPRGFTLLEVVTVAAVASIIFLILLRWLSTLGGVAGNVSVSSAAGRNATYVEYRLGNDISSATVCDPVSGAAIRTLDDRTLELYVNGRHTDGSEGVQLVRWRGTQGTLTRTAWDVSLDSNCLPEAGNTTTSRIMSTGVYTGSVQPFFTGMIDGVSVGTCRTVTRPIPGTESPANPNGTPTSTPEGDACFAPSIGTRITFLVPGQDTEVSARWDTGATPSTLDRTFAIPSLTGSAP